MSLKQTTPGFGPQSGAGGVVDTLMWLVRVPSLYGEEGPLCDAVAARVGEVRLAAPIRRYGHSIVVPVSRGTGGPKIALVGHLDVVRTEHDGDPRIDGDKLFGPGAADMKKIAGMNKLKAVCGPSEISPADQAAFKSEMEKAKAEWAELKKEMKANFDKKPKESPESVEAMRAFNDHMAQHPGFQSIIVPIGDGMWVGVRR